MKRIQILSLILLMSILGGCSNEAMNNINKTVNMNSSTKNNIVHNRNEVIQYLVDNYDFTESELQGLDVIKFVEDFEVYDRDWTSDLLREVIESQKEYYIDDGYTEAFEIFNYDEGGTVNEDLELSHIGYYYSSGTYNQSMVFDIINKIGYINSVGEKETIELSDKDIEKLKELSSKYKIKDWQTHYSGLELDTTGSHAWKLVFEYTDETTAVYGGYTGNMTYIPNNYSAVTGLLKSIANVK